MNIHLYAPRFSRSFGHGPRFIIIIAALMICLKPDLRAQEGLCQKTLSEAQLKRIQQDTDPAWKFLIKEAEKMGYRVNPEVKWGVEFTDSRLGSVTQALIGLDGKPGMDAALVYVAGKGRKEPYRAIIVGKSNLQETLPEYLEKATEQMVVRDGDGYKLADTHSFKTCLLALLRSSCGSACLAAYKWCPNIPFIGRTGCIVGICGGCYTGSVIMCMFGL
jgi:hypothetical protein